MLALAGACGGGAEGGLLDDAGQVMVGADGGAGPADMLDANQAPDGAAPPDAGRALDGAAISDASELDAESPDADLPDAQIDLPDAQIDLPDAQIDLPDAQIDAQIDAQVDATVGDASVCSGSAVDVVWVIDGSGSMLPYAVGIQTRLKDLLAGLSTAGVDARVTVITGVAFNSVLADTCLGNCQSVVAEVQSQDALDVLLATFSSYQARLRAGVRTDIVVSSDDNASLAASTFRTQMTSLLGHPFTFHANVTDAATCVGFAAGTVYQQLASDTGGLYVPLCDQTSAATSALVDGIMADATSCPLGG